MSQLKEVERQLKKGYQECILHKIRNSIRYVASKDMKEFVQDLRPVNTLVSEGSTLYELDRLDAK
jgi:transposase-like protein